ncbi:MAG: protein kinase [Chloroflexi bacterium]|nr:protein kinase [Chloroflexota bacterium]
MLGHLLKGRYRIVESLGKGGAATVFKANDEVLGRVVAVKVLDERCGRDEAFIERFRREAQSAAGIHHPNVVTVFDTGQEGDAHFIVMEYIEGRTLKSLLADGPLPADKSIRIAVQIARALAHAHRAGVVHRDVKPPNVIVTPDGVVKIADFGIARVLDEPGLTRTGKVLGTAEYLSPEQASGRGADERSDIYSFGVVLFEMLVGRPPFMGKNPVEVAARQVTEQPPLASELNAEVPGGLALLVSCFLSKNPDERPSNFERVVEDLLPWMGQEEPTRSLPIQRGVSARSPWVKAIATLGVLIAVLAVYYVAGRKPVERTVGTGQSAVSVLVPIKPEKIKDYDPEGNGVERPDEVAYAIDGNPQTTWDTEGYANAQFGNLKSGVGVYVDFSMPLPVKEVRVRSVAPGWDGEIKGSNDGRNWRVLSSRRDMSTDVTFRVTGSYRYYLLWITNLTKIPGRSNYRVAIAELNFKR